jgi:hypothetical protein
MLRCVFFGCRVSWLVMLHFVACAIAKHYVYSCGQINPQKATHQIDRVVARVSIAQWCQLYPSVFR